MVELLARIKQEYARMIALSVNSSERIYGQMHMAFLRDLIAYAEERDPYDVQSEFEERASLIPEE